MEKWVNGGRTLGVVFVLQGMLGSAMKRSSFERVIFRRGAFMDFFVTVVAVGDK